MDYTWNRPDVSLLLTGLHCVVVVLSTNEGTVLWTKAVTVVGVTSIKAAKAAAAGQQHGASVGDRGGGGQGEGALAEADMATSRMGGGGKPLTFKTTLFREVAGLPAGGGEGGGEGQDAKASRAERGGSAMTLWAAVGGVKRERMILRGVAGYGGMRTTMMTM